ncbi:MAG: hypothetical protein ABIN74_15425, partial [Ferruginibacter sp.]
LQCAGPNNMDRDMTYADSSIFINLSACSFVLMMACKEERVREDGRSPVYFFALLVKASNCFLSFSFISKFTFLYYCESFNDQHLISFFCLTINSIKKASRKDAKDAQRRKEISTISGSLRLCVKPFYTVLSLLLLQQSDIPLCSFP